MSRTAGGAESRRPNHLLGQTSPYLLQHLHNPVDWHPWEDATLERARRENKPIFLSIGYAACHWCHVMERESFEDPEIAAFLNEHFVSIKVDREERPDVDEIYMNAVQLMSGHGGWPLNVFLTPELAPFMGGTYFPPRNRRGMIGFDELLQRIRDAWCGRDDEVRRSAEQLTARLREIADALPPGERGEADEGSDERVEIAAARDLARAAAELSRRFDSRWGGFGAAPKFPPDGALALLLREHGRSGEPLPLRMVDTTLERMARGGIYDHIGGGFARYSVDERWLVPHFEKMLYNQALLVPLYVDAWLLTGRPLYRRVVEQTLDFVARELTDPAGAFLASLDADSEGHEGRFYVWTPAQLRDALGADGAEDLAGIYGIEPGGNFEGASIPNLLAGSLADRAAETNTDEGRLDARLAPLRARLLEARERRPRPARDDKVLTSWNGLMIGACARAHQALGRPADLEAARRAADFVLDELYADGRLRVTWRAGEAKLNGYLDDYAFLARGLVDLYEAGFERRHLDAAAALADTLVARFEDPVRGGFFFVSDDHEPLLTRQRSLHDGALPAGAGVAVETLLRLAALLGRDDLEASARRALGASAPLVGRAPSAYGALLVGADLARGPLLEIAIVGARDDPATAALLAEVRRRFLPRRVVAAAEPGHESPTALLEGRDARGGRPTAYVCRRRVCAAPTTDPAELGRQLDGAARER